MVAEYILLNTLIALLVAFVFLLVVLSIWVIVMKWLRNAVSKDEHYVFTEIGALRKTAKTLGIDINYEKKLLEMNDYKTFRRKLEERIIADTFPEKKKDDKNSVSKV